MDKKKVTIILVLVIIVALGFFGWRWQGGVEEGDTTTLFTTEEATNPFEAPANPYVDIKTNPFE